MRKKPKRQRKVKEKDSYLVRTLTQQEKEALHAEARLIIKLFNEHAIKNGMPTVQDPYERLQHLEKVND